jgi:hypothetical protein
MTRALLGVALVLAGGQTAWFLPSRLHTGDVVRCVVGAKHIDGTVKATGSEVYAAKGGLKLAIARRSNGSTRVDCGTTNVPQFRRPTLPYLIGPNGFDLARGPNRLSRLTATYGRPSAKQPGAGNCLVVWRAAGLRARFRGACAADSVLVGATARGSRWSSLDGVHVGDSVARMVYEAPGAKRVDGRWRVSAGLDALVAHGSVTGFEIVPR